MMMYANVVLFVFLAPSALGAGGMAELKSITGDEPYSGPGTNPPLVIPRPMGFWGRPRYSPAGYFGGSPYMGGGVPYLGGGSPYYGGADRFTSLSYSPYEVDGQLPFERLNYNYNTDNTFEPSSMLLSLFGGGLSNSPSFSSSTFRRTPYQPFLDSSNSPSQFRRTAFQPQPSFSGQNSPSPFISESRNSPFSPSQVVPSSSDSVSLSSGLGGFYKGKGNEMIGH